MMKGEFLDVIFENGTGVDYAKKYKEKFDSQIVFVSSKSSLIFKTQGLKALCFIRKSHLDNDFKVFKQLYDEECKNEMKLIFELNKGMNKNQMAYITLMSDDIIYAECYAHELIIHTYEHEYAVKMTLKKFMEQVKQLLNADVSMGKKKDKPAKEGKGKGKASKLAGKLPKISLENMSMTGSLDKTEVMLIRVLIAIILINIIFVAFSKVLYGQMDKKQKDVEGLISSENAQIGKINTDINSLNTKNTKYTSLTEELKAINDKISNIAEMKNSIPNLLNQIMYTIPEGVQLTSIQNTTGKKISIIAQASDYDQLGYFIAKIKVSGILNNAVSSSSQKSGDVVTVTIEGELP